MSHASSLRFRPAKTAGPDNLYAERDHEGQGEHFMRHLDRMTVEGLHSKSAIAGELAHRDAEIAALRKAGQQALSAMERYQSKRLDDRFDAEIETLRKVIAQAVQPVEPPKMTREAWNKAYAAIMVERAGMTEAEALSAADSADDCFNDDESPSDAVDEEISNWTA
jgi:hypothetical protein